MSDNREHLERLFSEPANMADAPPTEADARRFARLARLLSTWRSLGPSVDEADLARTISARIHDEVELQASARVDQLTDPSIPAMAEAPGVELAAKSFRAVDDLLKSAVRPLPAVNWQALTSRISGAVRRETEAPRRSATALPRGSAFKWFIRIAAPIAAAAVIALALWGMRPSPRIAQDATQQGRSKIEFALEEPEGKSGKVTITFDESRPRSMTPDEVPLERIGIADGPRNEKPTEIPIDPALEP